jgi:8-oxo-dGTP diphosphatase
MEFGLSPKVFLHDARGLCLVLRRSGDSKTDAGRWDLPGGKLEPGEELVAGLRREVREETGLEYELDGVAGVGEKPLPGVTAIVLVFRGRAVGGALRLSDEHVEARWIPVAELGALEFCDHLKPVVRGFVTASEARRGSGPQ